MPTVVVLLPSTTYRALDFMESAEGIGAKVIVGSDAALPLEMGDGYIQVDCADPERATQEIVELNNRVPIDGVVAADDSGVITAALVAEELGLIGNPPLSAAATRDKYAQRQALAAAEVPQPSYHLLHPQEDPPNDLKYPLVVKPLDRSAGQGVLRADDLDDLRIRIKETREIVGADADLIIEEYLPGDEVALEGLLTDGLLTTLAIFDKPGASRGPAFPETILVTPSLLGDDQLAEVQRVASRATEALGLTSGPVHIEMKVSGTKVGVIEVAARSIGGLCSRSLNFGLMETSLEVLILRNALGRDKLELRRELHASGVLMIPIPRAGRFQGFANESEIREIPGVTGIELNARQGDHLEPPPVGDRYLGFVFARAKERGAVLDALTAAFEMGRVEIV